MALKPELSTFSNPSPRCWETTASYLFQSLAGHQELQEGDSLVGCRWSRRDTLVKRLVQLEGFATAF